MKDLDFARCEQIAKGLSGLFKDTKCMFEYCPEVDAFIFKLKSSEEKQIFYVYAYEFENSSSLRIIEHITSDIRIRMLHKMKRGETK